MNRNLNNLNAAFGKHPRMTEMSRVEALQSIDEVIAARDEARSLLQSLEATVVRAYEERSRLDSPYGPMWSDLFDQRVAHLDPESRATRALIGLVESGELSPKAAVEEIDRHNGEGGRQ